MAWAVSWAYVEILVAVECEAPGMTLKKSLINHQQVGTRIFAAMGFGKGDVFGYYCGPLVYENMTWRQHTTKRYGEAFVRAGDARDVSQISELDFKDGERLRVKRASGVESACAVLCTAAHK